MRVKCPNNCYKHNKESKIQLYGSYYRTSDRRHVQRYRCTRCSKYFSQATFSKTYGQNKRQLNYKIYQLLASGMSQRRCALILNINLKTVARKLEFLGNHLRHQNLLLRNSYPEVKQAQFDDLETFEHTKLKPLSVSLMVEYKTRYILGFEVSKMPAKGLLVKKALKKYGFRKDQRACARNRLFRRMKPHLHSEIQLLSDQNPHYPKSIQRHLPNAKHNTVKGQRGAITGQGELKKINFDPLFSLNHTCAMKRANINRLFRKTWCTTKKMQSLCNHLEIYLHFHNQVLLKKVS